MTSDPTSYGLYDESNVQDLAFGRPIFGRGFRAGTFVLRFKVEESTDLENSWIPLDTMDLDFNTITKEVEVEFDPPNVDAYCYRLKANP